MHRGGEQVDEPLVGVRGEVDGDVRLRGHGRGDLDVEEHLAVGLVAGAVLRPVDAHREDLREVDPDLREVAVQVALPVPPAELGDGDRLARAVEVGREVVELGHVGGPQRLRLRRGRCPGADGRRVGQQAAGRGVDLRELVLVDGVALLEVGARLPAVVEPDDRGGVLRELGGKPDLALPAAIGGAPGLVAAEVDAERGLGLRRGAGRRRGAPAEVGADPQPGVLEVAADRGHLVRVGARVLGERPPSLGRIGLGPGREVGARAAAEDDGHADLVVGCGVLHALGAGDRCAVAAGQRDQSGILRCVGHSGPPRRCDQKPTRTVSRSRKQPLYSHAAGPMTRRSGRRRATESGRGTGRTAHVVVTALRRTPETPAVRAAQPTKSNGSERMRTPVAWCTAFAIAAAVPTMPISPMPLAPIGLT